LIDTKQELNVGQQMHRPPPQWALTARVAGGGAFIDKQNECRSGLGRYNVVPLRGALPLGSQRVHRRRAPCLHPSPGLVSCWDTRGGTDSRWPQGHKGARCRKLTSSPPGTTGGVRSSLSIVCRRCLVGKGQHTRGLEDGVCPAGTQGRTVTPSDFED
jgi:hypothetical protein